MPQTNTSTRLFLRHARRDFLHTGAIAPSSRFLARAITSRLGADAHPIRALEAGGGTGALTSELLRRLPAGSHLDIYEINAQFAAHLESRFAKGAGGSTVKVVCRRIQEIPSGSGYDAIVSGLPLNNFEPSQVSEILEILMASLRPGGRLSFFEYMLIRGIRAVATTRAEKLRLRQVGNIMSRFLKQYEFGREAVLLNIPPAVVHHLKRPLP